MNPDDPRSEVYSDPEPPLRVVTTPRFYVLARPHLDMAAVEAYLADEGKIAEQGSPLTWVRSNRPEDPSASDADLLVEFGGRVCYNSFGHNQGRRSTAAYVENILENQHGSVLEHAVWSLLIADISRGLSHELVRHRQFSFSQQSSRYVTARREAVLPPQLDALPSLQATWVKLVTEEFEAQEYLVRWYEVKDSITQTTTESVAQNTARRKRAKEVGRSAMPTAAVTRLLMTGNARAWRWFLEVRGSLAAEPEIRRLACSLLPVFIAESPFLFGDMAVSDEGGAHVVCAHHKV